MVDQEAYRNIVDLALDPEMAINRHRDPDLPADFDWLSSRLRPQALRHIAEVVPEGEHHEAGAEDGQPSERHRQHAADPAAPSDQASSDQHERHEKVQAAEMKIVGHKAEVGAGLKVARPASDPARPTPQGTKECSSPAR